MNIGGFTATGPREANEDNLYYRDFSELDSFVNGICAFAMVSDGMGGYLGGDVASALAVACAKSYLEQLMDMAGGNRIDLDAPAALTEIVQNAHESILAESSSRGNLSMGATFVGAFVSPTHAWIGHVGDSRAYLIRAGQCRQLTEDHSQVGRMLSRGIITEDEAQNHPDRNRIERALGFNDARPDVTEVDLEPGDALLLCSDGVYTVLDASTLGSCVDGARDAASAAERAVKLALKRRTDDNSTAVVVINGLSAGSTERTMPQTMVASDRRAARTGTTQVNRPVQAARGTARSSAYNRHAGADTLSWRRALPFVLAVLLIGALVWLGMRGCSGETSVDAGTAVEGEGVSAGEPIAPTEAPEASQAPGQTVPQATDQNATQLTGAGEDTSTTTLEEGYELYTLPQDTVVELKYIDMAGTAQLFSYEQLALTQDPQLLPGATVIAQTTPDSYGRIEKTYQMLSDSYLDDLRRDLSSYQEGSTTFDSALSQIVEQSSYLALIQGLAQMGNETLNTTVAHLAIESLIVTGQ